MTMLLLTLAVAWTDPPVQAPNTLALPAGGTPGVGKLADVAWLAGHWVGDGLGGTCDEVWLPPLAGSGEMLGAFRFVAGGKTQFTEHFVLAQDGASLTLKLKHFAADFTGWEEKDKHVTFRLVKVETDAVYFGGLTYRKTAAGMDAFVLVTKGGKTTEAAFHFKRQK